MGAVYRARDARLNRDVALKVLPEFSARDEASRARFEREARAIAALSHPNIVAIHDVGTADATTYLVMELLDGETLRARLDATGGALPTQKALEIAAQIAQGLSAAHAKGIVHRDVKPENVFLTTDGRVKVLDFGIARALSGAAETTETRSAAPSDAGTMPGTVVGTVGYMAPEQVRGQPADHRADVFALGVVLLEMLTGRRAFAGGTPIEAMSAILSADPLESSTRTGEIPPNCLLVLRHCLEKQASERFESMRDLAFQLQALRTPSTTPERGLDERPSRWPRQAALLAAVAVVASAIGALVARQFVSGPRSAAVNAWIGIQPADDFSTPYGPPGGFRRAIGWSPDGRTLGFIAQKDGTRRIYLRALGGNDATPLAGTEGADTFVFSPDGAWIAFWANATGEIRKLPAAGGPVARVHAPGTVHGMAWQDPDRIVYAADRAIVEVPAGGGTPRTLKDFPTGRPASPVCLPGNTAMLFTLHEKGWTSGDERVMVLPLSGGEPRKLIDSAADAAYLSSGHIVFLRQGTLFAVPFDPDRLELRGSEVAMVSGISQTVGVYTNSNLTLVGQYSVSAQGTLAYLAYPLLGYPQSELVAVDRRGAATSIGAPTLAYTPSIGLSAPGDRLAVIVQTMTERTLGTYDTKTKILNPVTKSGESSSPVWMGDQRIAFIDFTDWLTRLAIIHLDTAKVDIVPDSNGFWPTSWSPKTNCLAGLRGSVPTFHVWTYCPDGPEPKFRPFFESKATEGSVKWSPDGRYLAYLSTADGKSEIFVRPYPDGPERQLSNNGGIGSAWSPLGHELFYVEGRGPGSREARMMSVLIETTPELRAGAPSLLFTFDPRSLNFGLSNSNGYEVAPDGKHFYTTRGGLSQPPSPPVTKINVIVNWLEELATKVPGR